MALFTVARSLPLSQRSFSSPLSIPRAPCRLKQFKRAVTQQGTSQQTSSKDVIERIKTDHGDLDDYYKKYKGAVKAGDRGAALEWFNQFVWEICRHSVSEELVVYPLLEGLGDRGKQLADKSRKDHHKVKEMLSEMESIGEPIKLEGKMDAMMEELREHIKMEEAEDLPLLKEKLSLGARENAGTTFALGKNLAPTHPHTAVPEKPVVIEAALGLLATPVDKLRDMFSKFPSNP